MQPQRCNYWMKTLPVLRRGTQCKSAWTNIPTKRSLKARPNRRTLDGEWRDLVLNIVQRMRTFPRVAVMANGMFRKELIKCRVTSSSETKPRVYVM